MPARAAVSGVFQAADTVLVLFVGAIEGDNDAGLAGQVIRLGREILDLARRAVLARIAFRADIMIAEQRIRVFVKVGSIEHLRDVSADTEVLADVPGLVHDHPAQVEVGLQVRSVIAGVLVAREILLDPTVRDRRVRPSRGGLEILEIERGREHIITQEMEGPGIGVSRPARPGFMINQAGRVYRPRQLQATGGIGEGGEAVGVARLGGPPLCHPP